MRKRGAVLIALTLTAAIGQTAFTGVTVVDVAAGRATPNQTVVIEGSRITAAGDARRTQPPRGARIIGAHGKFLMPGLWDMHVHELPGPHIPELFVANGITGVRDMFDEPLKLTGLRKGSRVSPRIVAQGRALNRVLENDRQLVVRTPDQAREAVRRQIREGGDFVKVYNGLSRAAYFAIAAECKRAGVPFVGHVPDSVTTTEAAAAGQRSIEHLDGVFIDASPAAGLLRRSRRFNVDLSVLQSFNATRANALYAAYRNHGLWHCPTLSIFRAPLRFDEPEHAARRYLPPAWFPKPPALRTRDLDRATYKKALEITGMMFRAGVRLLAGTDTGQPLVFPGFSLHEELELLVEAGIPAPAVLRIATLGAAEFLSREKDLGTIAPGKLADLVLLDANPLPSIANTRRVWVVVVNGRVLDRAALDGLLADAASATGHRE